MKILLISPGYFGGGAQLCVGDLFSGLRDRGIDVSMLVSDRSPSHPPGIRGVRLPGEKYLRAFEKIFGPIQRRYPGSVVELARIKRGDFDVVHLHNIHGGWISLPALQRLSRRMPFVWTFHDAWAVSGGLPHDLSRVLPIEEIEKNTPAGVMPLHPHTPRARKLRRFLAKWMPHAAAMISPSQYVLDLAKNCPNFRDTPGYRIPNGVRLLSQAGATAPRSEARARFGLPPDKPVMLLIAMNFQNPFKGARYAVEMLRRLAADDVTLLLLGDNVSEMASRVRQRSVWHAATNDPAVLCAAYRAADITLIPSVAENFPYVALESLACQTPLLTFAVGGLPEIVGDNERGMAVPPFDVQLMAEAAKKLCTDAELRTRMGTAGRQWCVAECAMDQFIDRNIAVYESVISAEKRSGEKAR